GVVGKALLTYHGKQLIALFMVDRGKDCFYAGLDLRERKRNGYVWRYLICQAAELLLKGCLQLKDFDKYDADTLKDDYRHRLGKLADECSNAYAFRIPDGALRTELENLSKLYEQQHLRYASAMDI